MADVLTRPFEIPENLTSDHPFYRGPDFLYDAEDKWPRIPAPPPVPLSDPEVHQRAGVAHTTVPHSPEQLPDAWFSKVSTFYRLKIYTAVFLRLRDYLLEKRMRPDAKIRSGRIDIDELIRARDCILIVVQRSHLSTEIQALKAGRDVPRSSPVWKYKPAIIHGLLRITGRLATSSLAFTWKYPVVLPSKCHVTELLINDAHMQSAHGTAQMVLCNLRQAYHLPRAKQSVQRVVSKCINCKRYTRKFLQQQMSDLPSVRQQTNQPAFYSTGCDIAGPFNIRRARSEVKRYLCVFTCMTSRAVHFETMESLESQSFLQAFRRFIARRGPIFGLKTDNATTFKGADREIREAILEWNDTVRDTLRQAGIKWEFQTPYASSQSGVWERMIRAARWHLRHTLKEQVVSDETFRTVVVEVEAILNGRPLTACSDDPDDLNPITPSQLIAPRLYADLPPGIFRKEDGILRNRYRQS